MIECLGVGVSVVQFLKGGVEEKQRVWYQGWVVQDSVMCRNVRDWWKVKWANRNRY